MSNREEVDQLLGMYQEYKTLSGVEAGLSLKLAKAKLVGDAETAPLNSEYLRIKKELQELSDKMTFANPIIWMMYKYEAYANDAQPIRTMHDFRVHCSKDGYICTKRFNFLNDQLVLNGYSSLVNATRYTDDMLLPRVITESDIVKVTSESEFVEAWTMYEYNRVDGHPAKWLNYPRFNSFLLL